MQSNDFGQKIGNIVHDYYNQKVSSKGKPKSGKMDKNFKESPSNKDLFQLTRDFDQVVGILGKEWTVLSAFVKEELGALSVVSLATGTKCLGENEVSLDGGLVHDCHAEVLSRRSLIKYWMHNLRTCLENENSSCFEITSGKFRLRKDVLFHFYSTLPPCGDATIAPQNCHEPPSKKTKLETYQDIHRTGAKSIEGLDTFEEGTDFHVTGVMRTKPGRGDPTKSLSCSDKLLKWNIVGLQGSLLSILVKEPIKLKSVTFGGTAVDESSIKRALFERAARFATEVGIFRCYQVPLVFDRFINTALPACPSGICHNCVGLEVVVVDGRSQGITNKNRHTDAAKSPVSRVKIASEFIRLVQLLETKAIIDIPGSLKILLKNWLFQYGDLKDCSDLYRENKKNFSQLVPDPDVRRKRRIRLNMWLIKFRSLIYKPPVSSIDCLVISDNDDPIANGLVEIGVNVVKVCLCEKKINSVFWKTKINDIEDKKTKLNLLFTTKEIVDAFQVFLKEIVFEEPLMNNILERSILFGVNANIQKQIEAVLCVPSCSISDLERLDSEKVVLIGSQESEIPDHNFQHPKSIMVETGFLFKNVSVNPTTVQQKISIEVSKIPGFFDFVIFGDGSGNEIISKVGRAISPDGDTKFVFKSEALYLNYKKNAKFEPFFFDYSKNLINFVISGNPEN